MTAEYFLSDIRCPIRFLPRQPKEQNSLSNLLYFPAFNLLTLETRESANFFKPLLCIHSTKCSAGKTFHPLVLCTNKNHTWR